MGDRLTEARTVSINLRLGNLLVFIMKLFLAELHMRPILSVYKSQISRGTVC